MDVLALIVSGLALLFSVFAFYRQFGLQRRLAAIEEARRQEEIEARLSASVSIDLDGLDFVLYNSGSARAQNVHIENRTPGVQLTHEAANLALPLDAGQTYRFGGVAEWSVDAMEVELTWSDELGPHSKTVVLAIRA